MDERWIVEQVRSIIETAAEGGFKVLTVTLDGINIHGEQKTVIYTDGRDISTRSLLNFY